MDFRRLINSLRSHLLLYVTVFMSVLAMIVLGPQLTAHPMFVSTAKVLLTPPAQQSQDSSGVSLDGNAWLSDEATLRELMVSERLVERVVRLSSLKSDWQTLRDRIKIESLSTGGSGRVTLFSVAVSDESPRSSQQVATALVRQFQTYVEELSAKEFINTRRFLDELVVEAREKVDASDEKLLQIVGDRADSKESEAQLAMQNELETERRKLREEVALGESEISAMSEFLSGRSEIAPWAVLQNNGAGGSSSGQDLEGAISTARVKLVELEQLYTGENSRVLEQKARLGKLQQMQRSRVRSFVQSVESERTRAVQQKRGRLQSVESSLAALRRRQLTGKQRREATKLERQRTMWEENYLSLVKQLYQARVMEQSSRRQGAITVLEDPSVGQPEKGFKQVELGKALAFGIPFGLTIALVVVLSVDYLSSSMRILPRIESSLELKVLGVIPSVDEETAAAWESYKRLETMPRSRAALITD